MLMTARPNADKSHALLRGGKWLSKHPSSEDLERYFLHHANQNETQVVEEHLLICERCQDAAFEVELYLAALREA